MLSRNLIKCSAAGSGKTWGICNDALNNEFTDKKILITTYTHKGVETIESEYKKQNLGIIDKKTAIRSWYQFLLYDLIKPYQTFLTDINEVKSFDFSHLYGIKNFNKTGTKSRYINCNGNIKANYASEMAYQLNVISNGMLISRLEAIYSYIYIDEIQDMAGYDLILIEMFMDSKITIVCVGDNKQATYKTHNTQKGKRYSGENIWSFFNHLEESGKAILEFDLCSRRFNKDICEFANMVFSNENNITTCMDEKTPHDGVFLILEKDVSLYYNYFKPTVLKYDIKTRVDGYPSFNFGQCKGMTFDRVLIYPNKPLKQFIKGNKLSSPQKYYIAATRPKFSLAIVVDEFPNSEYYRPTNIELCNFRLNAMKFVVKHT